MRRAGAVLFCIPVAVILSGCAHRGPDPNLDEALLSVRRLAVELPEKPFAGPLSQKAAVQRATALNDDIAALLAQVKVAAEQRAAARDLRDPELRLTYGRQDGDATREQSSSDVLAFAAAGGLVPTGSTTSGNISDETDSYRVALRFFPPNPWAMARRVSAETANVYAAAAELVSTHWELGIEVRKLFAEIHYREQDVAVIGELADVYKQALDLVMRRAARGQATVQDTMTSSRRYLGALNDKDEAGRRLNAARRELSSLVAVPAEDLHLLVDDDTFAEPDLASLDVSRLVGQALDNRADLSSRYWRARAAREAYQEYRAERLPWPNFLQASYSADDGTRDRTMTGSELDLALGRTQTGVQTTHDDSDSEEWRIDAGFNLPLFSRFASEPKALYEEWRGAEARERKARTRARHEIRDALAAAIAIGRSRDSYEAQSRPIVENMEKTLAGIEDLSGIDPEAIARVREQLLESRRMKIEAALDFRLAVLDLEAVLGMSLGAVTPPRTLPASETPSSRP